MNWEAIGAISAILSAIAVIATLGYVAVQIRQNTSALRSAATQGAYDQHASMYDALSTDPKLADIFVRGLEAPDTLDRIETGRFYSFLLSVMVRTQNWELQTRSRALDKEVLESTSRILRQISGMPGFQRFWEDRRHMFTQGLATYLEQEVFLTERDPTYHPLGVRGGDQGE
jgi:hypothetical protein